MSLPVYSNKVSQYIFRILLIASTPFTANFLKLNTKQFLWVKVLKSILRNTNHPMVGLLFPIQMPQPVGLSLAPK